MLKTIAINHDNFETFFHKGIAWISYLNADLNVSLTNGFDFNSNKKRSIFVEFYDTPSSFNPPYLYPDEDICLFRDFPHSQLVFPSIVFAETFKKTQVKCSCTIVWLIQHGKYYLNGRLSQYDANLKAFLFYPEGFENLSARQCLRLKNFQAILRDCNFTSRFEKCSLLSATQTLSQEMTLKGIGILFCPKKIKNL